MLWVMRFEMWRPLSGGEIVTIFMMKRLYGSRNLLRFSQITRRHIQEGNFNVIPESSVPFRVKWRPLSRLLTQFFCQKIKKRPFSADPPTFPPTASFTRRKEPLEGRCCITNDQNAWACETIPVVQSGWNITILQKYILNRPFYLAPTHAFYNIPATRFLYCQSKSILQVTPEVITFVPGAISK